MSSLAQDEVRKLSERVKFGFKRSIKDGRVVKDLSKDESFYSIIYYIPKRCTAKAIHLSE